MAILVTGSIATDHLMTFPGKFTDSFVADKIDKISVSFMVNELDVRRGGVAPNIAFGMGRLGLNPVLVGAVGADFAEYQAWLERHGVNTSGVHVSTMHHTARFICTTDTEQNQIASFYPGAMQEAVNIELQPIVDRVGGADVVLIGANDPGAMARHTQECRDRGYDFAADPSQQLSFMDGKDIAPLVDGAKYLFSNEYESALIEQKSGLKTTDIASMVEVRVTTLGAEGARIHRRGQESVFVGVCKPERIADPTGVGDAFRSGYLTGIQWGLGDERAAQVGSLMATYVIETVGTQEYTFTRESFLARLAQNYGDAAAEDVAVHVVVS